MHRRMTGAAGCWYSPWVSRRGTVPLTLKLSASGSLRIAF